MEESAYSRLGEEVVGGDKRLSFGGSTVFIVGIDFRPIFYKYWEVVIFEFIPDDQ